MEKELLNDIVNDLNENIKRREEYLEMAKGGKYEMYERGFLNGLRIAMYIINLNEMIHKEE